jgi:hypothetical protein
MTAHTDLAPRRPKGRGERLLYLDYDGVLHGENVLWHPRRGAFAGEPGFVLFEHAALLDDLLQPFPQVKIVISTSWVRLYGCAGAAKRLPPGLRGRVIGATFHSRMDGTHFDSLERGRQVLADVHRREPLDWFALDDVDEGWSAASRHHVLITDEVLGISAPGTAGAISAQLRRMAQQGDGSC